MPESGFPARTGREDYGPTKEDEKKRRDPRSEFNAAQVELTLWQLGAAGLISPMGVIFYNGVDDLETESRFAWDGAIYTTSNPYVAITKLGVGQYRFIWNANVPNKIGDPQTLIIQGAYADAYGLPGHVLLNKRAAANVVAPSPAQVDVDVRDNAGTLIDSDIILLGF